MHSIDFLEKTIEYQFIQVRDDSDFTWVMLHEGLGSVSMWKDFPTQLAEHTGCNALVYSRLGYGNSSALTGPRTMNFMHEEALQALPRLLEQLEIQNPVLFGHSDGASIALIHAGSGATPVHGCMVLAPHVMVEDICIQSIAAAKVTYETTDLRDKLRRYHADVDGAFWGWCNIWLNPEFRAWNIEDHVANIRCPVMAIQGFDDEYGTMEQIDRIARLLPGTELIKLQQCRHSPHRDQPRAVLDAAARYINQLRNSRIDQSMRTP